MHLLGQHYVVLIDAHYSLRSFLSLSFCILPSVPRRFGRDSCGFAHDHTSNLKVFTDDGSLLFVSATGNVEGPFLGARPRDFLCLPSRHGFYATSRENDPGQKQNQEWLPCHRELNSQNKKNCSILRVATEMKLAASIPRLEISAASSGWRVGRVDSWLQPATCNYETLPLFNSTRRPTASWRDMMKSG